MVEPLRHRQTKGAETDMPGLPPPRHIPTLPTLATHAVARKRRLRGMRISSGSKAGTAAVGRMKGPSPCREVKRRDAATRQLGAP